MSDDQLLKDDSLKGQSQPTGSKTVLFEQIKILQSLPDEVVEQFLKCKGTLRHKKDILKYAKQS